MATTQVNITLNLRSHQLSMYRGRRRFEVRVVHRRFGKTFLAVAELVVDALQSKRRRWQGFYICPTYTQAKAVAWNYVKDFCGQIPGVTLNESELRVTMPNGATVQLLGAEKYDALRGRYADSVVLDETAHIPSTAWTTVLSPMLADRKGRAMFIGTPQGRMNLFHDVWDYASSGKDPDWRGTLLTYKDTGVLDPKEVDRLRRTLREEEFAQELECSWDAAIRGAYYAKEMAEADRQGRVTTVKHDKELPVYVALDLGWSDAMVAVFFQQTGTETRVINCETYELTSIPDMVQQWRQLPYPVDHVILPHDAKVRELGSGRSRQEIFHSLGCSTSICPNQSIHEGISAVRGVLGNTWFDRDATKVLREALVAYRSEYDEVKGVHRLTPVHDWSSHYADAMRYLALGRPQHQFGWGERPAFQGGLVV